MVDPVRELVSVVIVNYNGAHLLKECLNSVLNQEYRPLEIIIVDNASTDESVELVRSTYPECKLLVNRTNQGYAEGNNQGTAAANGEFVILLNNDTTVDSAWIPGLLGVLQQPGVAVVASKVITDDIPPAFYEMNGSINYLGYNVMRQFSDLSRIFYAGGTSLAFRRELVGTPFLKEYFLYQEDIYLSWRLRMQGWDVRMAQESVVSHRGSATTKRESSARITFYQERNRALNWLLLYETRTLMILLPYFVADALAKIVFSLFSHRKSLIGILRSYWWLATHVRWTLLERKKHQTTRVIPDSQIMRWMSTDVVDTARGGRIAPLINSIFRRYADFVGLKHLEEESNA